MPVDIHTDLLREEADRTGTYVRPPSTYGAASIAVVVVTPFAVCFTSSAPIVSVTVLFVLVRTISLPSYATSYPSASTIARTGTIVRSERISGCASNSIALLLYNTWTVPFPVHPVGSS